MWCRDPLPPPRFTVHCPSSSARKKLWDCFLNFILIHHYFFIHFIIIAQRVRFEYVHACVCIDAQIEHRICDVYICFLQDLFLVIVVS